MKVGEWGQGEHALMAFWVLSVVHNGRMKRALYLIFIAWIALQSTLLQAHVVAEDLHFLMHAAHAVDQLSSDAGTDEPCDAVVCVHAVGVSSVGLGFEVAAQSFVLPAPANPRLSLPLLDDIDRPKWPATAPRVAGI